MDANLLSEVAFSSLLEWQKCAGEYRMRICCSCFRLHVLVIRAVIRVVNLELSSCETLPSGHSVEFKKQTREQKTNT